MTDIKPLFEQSNSLAWINLKYKEFLMSFYKKFRINIKDSVLDDKSSNKKNDSDTFESIQIQWNESLKKRFDRGEIEKINNNYVRKRNPVDIDE